MLPVAIRSLEALATNIWWSWDADASALWSEVDPTLWGQVRHNPVALLRDVDAGRWHDLAADTSFVARLSDVYARFEQATHAGGWCADGAPEMAGKTVLYLSMEFGLHESLRIYSGGLGVLAGDHVRSASDLGVPLIGFGLFYRNGYFRQVFDEGRQAEAYPENVPQRLPVTLCRDASGTAIAVQIPIGTRKPLAHVYRVDVGRTKLYLLCMDHSSNAPEDRALTSTLYGGDNTTRIQQEILLGIGAVRAMRALDESFDLVHMNEGHCAFAALALIEERVKAGDAITDALAWARTRTVFTTHTPVPAGHDRFDLATVTTALSGWSERVGMTEEEIMDLGRVHPGASSESLCMTVVALRASHAANGVSELHGAISRDMWRDLWPDLPVDEVPIGHITNGVHPTFWMHPASRALFDETCPGWRERPWDAEVWAPIAQIDAERLWAWRSALRRELVALATTRTGVKLDPNALTIGFARRFAPYKRGDLIFTDPDRLLSLIEGDQPVQLLYAGKAHPRDTKGKDLIETVLKWTRDRRFRDRVVVLEDYDMVLGRALTSGSDVWLNNPRRPREASGTSGQKVILNGGLNLSVLDGWWPEGFDGTNGWEIGGGKDWPNAVDASEQDAFDAESMYAVLETSVLPEWRTRTAGVPQAWVERMRRSVATCSPLFTSHRMVRDYVLKLYAPALARLRG